MKRTIKKRFVALLYFFLQSSFLIAQSALDFIVKPLPEFEEHFNRTQGWTGADGVYSVQLRDSLVVWLFGDTWIGEVNNSRHENATMIANSIALQTGAQSDSVRFEFYWKTPKGENHQPFISPKTGEGKFWFFDGYMNHNILYLFLMQIERTGSSSIFDFRINGNWIAVIDNPFDSPAEWNFQQFEIPWADFKKTERLYFGSAFLEHDGLLYIYGVKEKESGYRLNKTMVVARVNLQDIVHFEKWEFLSAEGWKENADQLAELFGGFSTEYTVHYQTYLNRYVVTYTENGMSKNILLRFSKSPIGPWSDPVLVYQCPEVDWSENYFCYAAKAHPHLSQDENQIVISYVCNSLSFGEMAEDTRIYRPRFISVEFFDNSK